MAGGVQRHDVRMLQRGGELDLAPKPLDVDAGGHLRREHFYDDSAAERGFLGQEDPAHPAAAQLLVDAVRVAQGSLEAVTELGHVTIKIGRRLSRRERGTASRQRQSRRYPQVCSRSKSSNQRSPMSFR